MRISNSIGLLILILPLPVYSQEQVKKEVDLEILADQLFGFQDLDLNYEELYENMALLLSNPINLNKAGAEELRFLNILSESQVQSFINYRTENGELLSIYELQTIPGFDSIVINKIIPFVNVEDATPLGSLWKRIRQEKNNYLLIRYGKTLETKAGFNETTNAENQFRGNSNETYIRFRTSKPSDFSFGFTIEKDAGEAITWNPAQSQYGFDYNSFHIQLLNKGKLKNLLIGDYQAQFAQGLLFGGSFGYGKGSETVTTVRRSNLGFMPYTSANEAGYKRGIAFTYELTPCLFVSPFYSYAWRDATLVLEDNEEAFVSSFQTTGLHRNERELSTRHQIQEQNYGGVLSFKRKSIEAGVIANILEFNTPVNRSPQPYNQFTFEGQNACNIGAYFNYTLHNITVFTEAAKTIDEGFGFTGGLLGSLTPKLDVALHVRHYQRHFQSLYSNAFAENSLPQNESGIYWGWKYSWNRKLNANGYADLFRFPWLRYRNYAPSDGHEWLLRFTWQPTKNVMIYLQGREELKTRNESTEKSNLYNIQEGTKRNYWLNCDYGLTQKLKLKTRAQFSTFEIGGVTTKGMTLVQDISFDFGKFTITGRYALFDTQDYDNRQYVYERDVWLAYSLPAYSGVGIRNYILAEYTINKHLSLWLRFAHIRYTDKNEIGSGADTIEGDSKNDLSVQARIKF
ncbi:MAG TPA: helix-hairpin-helix domain-containing protein [Cyclobacteriaceae bacterium]|nr:helix-hairpin-helix domain-containing protein [Cyclobacteriaceae bacterium]